MRIKTTKQLTRFCFNNYLIINKNKKMKKNESKKIINWFKYLIILNLIYQILSTQKIELEILNGIDSDNFYKMIYCKKIGKPSKVILNDYELSESTSFIYQNDYLLIKFSRSDDNIVKLEWNRIGQNTGGYRRSLYENNLTVIPSHGIQTKDNEKLKDMRIARNLNDDMEEDSNEEIITSTSNSNDNMEENSNEEIITSTWKKIIMKR